MYYYRLYGMLLESELCFPEADELTPPVTPDATLTLGMPPEWVVTEYRENFLRSPSGSCGFDCMMNYWST